MFLPWTIIHSRLTVFDTKTKKEANEGNEEVVGKEMGNEEVVNEEVLGKAP